MSTEMIFILYLIYGFTYIFLGIIILQLKNIELSGFSIIRKLPLLGLFGLIHGLSEWVTLAQISGIYNEYNGYLLFFKEVFKVLSFYFLLKFSIKVVPENIDESKDKIRIRTYLNYVPLLLLLSWLIRFIYLYSVHGFQYLESNRAGSIIIIRYLMSLPAGIIGFIGLYLAGRKIKSMYGQKLYIWFYGLGTTLLIYGVMDGLFVREMEFFPANVINHNLFFRLTGIPIQFMKILIGILMIFYVTQIIRVFEKEKKAIIEERFAAKIIANTKEKMNREIHDHIIQKMFGASLKIEAYLGNTNTEYLESAKEDLKNGIGDARDIIRSSSDQIFHATDLSELVQGLLNDKKKEAAFGITFENHIPQLSHGRVSSETARQICYILQEIMTNAIKHSKAEKVSVRLYEEYDVFIMDVKDDGTGFIRKKEDRTDAEDEGKTLGIDIMKKRAKEIDGKIIIESDTKGVRVKLIVKWEVVS